MALINDIYVFVKDEKVDQEFETTSHPVEQGIDLTDYVRRSPLTLEITGEIVGQNYEDDFESLSRMAKDGELIEYIGLHTLSNAVITNITTSGDGTIQGGISVTVRIKEIRIAASPYVEGSGSTGTQQIEEAPAPVSEETRKRTHTVKRGDTLWKLAQSYYGSGQQFPRIFEANRDKLSDPDKIHVDQVLTIP